MSEIGLSQTQLAVRAGISRPTLAKVLNSSRDCTLLTIGSVAEELGLKVTISVAPIEAK